MASTPMYPWTSLRPIYQLPAAKGWPRVKYWYPFTSWPSYFSQDEWPTYFTEQDRITDGWPEEEELGYNEMEDDPYEIEDEYDQDNWEGLENDM